MPYQIVHFLSPLVLVCLIFSGLSWPLDELAARQQTTRSELVRRALMREVADAGVQIGEPEKVANYG